MKDELVRKIQSVLDRRITQETQVLYLLVELRKLMDREKYKDPVLRMFCNWVVHTSLEDPREGSRLVLSEFDALITGLIERNEGSPHFDHLSFSAFREALARCFESFGLSAKFINDKKSYERFVGLYSAIVGECPIRFSAFKTALKYVVKIELRGIESDVVFNGWPVLEWRATMKDGQKMGWAFPMG